MQSIELTVASIEEAIKKASEQFQVPADQLKTTVLEESPGLFGKKKLKVLVEAPVGKAVVETADKPARKPKAEPKAKSAKAEAKVEEPEEAEETEVEEPKATAPKAKADKPARKSKADAKATESEAKSSEEAPAQESNHADVIATQQDADDAIAVVTEMLSLANLEAAVTLSGLNGRYVNLEIDGKDTNYIVGKNGEVLNHLQYLLNVMISRKLANGIRVTIDGNSYRAAREEKLVHLATMVAEQVLARGEEAVFDALPAFERRVVHMALQEFEGVTTYSEGEEPERRVVIAPTAG